jgi:hypothetical protein
MIEQEVIVPSSDLTPPFPRLSCSQPGILTLAAAEQIDNAQEHLTAGSLHVTGDLTVAGKLNGRHIMQDGEMLDVHVAARNNPHRVTATQIGALPLTGGVIQGRLGIGVSNPQEMLEVNGRIQAGQLTVTGDLTVHGKVNGRKIEQDGDTLDEHLAAKNNPHRVTATQIGALPLTGGVIQGQLGIGTTNPERPLHIKAAGVGSDGTASARLIIENGEGHKWFLNTWDTIHQFSIGRVGTADDLMIDSNGQVTIPSFANGCSLELKQDVTALTSHEAFDILDALNPVKFRFKNDTNGELHLGFVAEDAPKLVGTPDRKGIRTLGVIAVLSKVVREQQRLLLSLQEQIRYMKTRLEDEPEQDDAMAH